MDSCVRQDSFTRQGIYGHKHFGWAKARRQAPPLPHGSYATAVGIESKIDLTGFIKSSISGMI